MKIPTRFAAAVAAVSMVAVTAACGSSTETAKPETSKADAKIRAMLPADVRDKGVLNVASDVPYPPFEFYDTDGKTVIGMDPDLGKAIGDVLGLTLTFNAVSFESMIPSLKSGKYDVLFTGMSDTPERQKEVTFVDYLQTGGSLMIKDGSTTRPGSLEELCGLTVGAQSATIIVDYLEGVIAPECAKDAQLKLSQFTGQDDLVQALRSGRVDVAVIPSPSAGYIVKTTKNEFELTFTLPFGILGIAVPKGSDKLAAAFEAALQKLIDDGTYTKTLTKYGLEKLALDKATTNAGTAS
ncbi:ABC transporter substrate-binding protein [Aeromicrobium fastidiosum]|uniref:ABC transporter substrate-binding protein n=1 Tax=Aeromicrobium fastidiosum TaxID=52699 RepID=A0A641AP13_9ACTN|nr:ABC transporter substrate-binding protein [Aeromicrobium fastidiosum]KAA1378471.1 ABC transporter substrate-binding protein [Aeromicrobium fastidiosum]MBP2392564.1 polar amino acid transport system substrate-binding protein [Aeromicrobium fastidiosum]